MSGSLPDSPRWQPDPQRIVCVQPHVVPARLPRLPIRGRARRLPTARQLEELVLYPPPLLAADSGSVATGMEQFAPLITWCLTHCVILCKIVYHVMYHRKVRSDTCCYTRQYIHACIPSRTSCITM